MAEKRAERELKAAITAAGERAKGAVHRSMLVRVLLLRLQSGKEEKNK